MFDIYFSPEYPSCPPQVLITTTGEFLQEHSHSFGIDTAFQPV